jgi:hypothetical protein
MDKEDARYLCQAKLLKSLIANIHAALPETG